MDHPQRILDHLSENADRLSPLLILTHDYPDPDALASAYALQFLATEKFGIRSTIVYGGIIGRTENKEMVKSLKIPVRALKPSDLRTYENIALVDTQPAFGNNSFPSKRRASIVIDQHASVKKPSADFAVIDTSLGATSALMAEALFLSGIDIPAPLATALVYGILTDTQNLKHTKGKETLTVYTTLLPLCDLRKLARIQNPRRSRRFFRSLSKAIHDATVRGRLIVTHLGPVETPDLVAQMADFLLTFENMSWSFCTGRFHGNLHVSLRFKNPRGRAGEVLRDIFQDKGFAGGHGTIAGGKVPVGASAAEEVWTAVEKHLTAQLTKRLRIPARAHRSNPFAAEPLLRASA